MVAPPPPPPTGPQSPPGAPPPPGSAQPPPGAPPPPARAASLLPQLPEALPAPGTPDLSALLPGWRVIATDDGEPYYYNDSTGETRWGRPQALPASAVTTL